MGASFKVFVEGGGDDKDLIAECRKAFSEFFRKAGFSRRMPRVVACGGRNAAFEDFCMSFVNGEDCILLVDSEAGVNAAHQQGKPVQWKPWDHLRAKDKWDVVGKVSQLAKRHKITVRRKITDQHAHMMVWCTESWFLADRAALSKFYGNGFNVSKLPPGTRAIETIPKTIVYSSLKNATLRAKTKGEYGKGPHSFKILQGIDAQLVINASPWAKRMVDYLNTVL